MTGPFHLRAAAAADRDAIWRALEPTIRAGDTYALDASLSREDALAYWYAPGHEVVVAEHRPSGEVAGTYFLCANHSGGGAHVANCGYVTAPAWRGRGVAGAMCADSLDRARARGFLAMQFNFVVSTNTAAVRAWQRAGFDIVGRLPDAFRHPALGLVDALVMYRKL